MSRRRYTGILLALGAASITWALGALGAFTLLDGALYDVATRHAWRVGPREPRVLVLEAGPREQEAGDEVWLRLLREVRALGAAQVVFAFLPSHVSATFYREAAEGDVSFGRHLFKTPEDPLILAPEPLPGSARGVDVPWGAVGLPVVTHGVYRQHLRAFPVPGGRVPALEVVARARLSRPGDDPGATPYFVNFLRGQDYLPTVRVDRALSHGLVPNLVRDRTVLVGLINTAVSDGLVTPLYGAERTLPLVEFQGYALETLIRNDPPRWLSGYWLFALLLLIGLVSVLLYQLMTLKAAAWTTLFLITAYCAAAWLTLSLTRWWLPVMELGAAQAGVFALAFGVRSAGEERALRRMLVETSAKLRDRVIPTHFFASQEHWVHVAALLNQTLELKRLILLEREERDHRVREVQALYCSLDDIDEKRRDYLRSPYSLAVAEGAPIRLTRPFLRGGEAGEEQYLVPLMFVGDVLGFWAFGVDPAKVARLPNFRSMVADYASQISEMLYHRERWRGERDSGSSSLMRFLRMEGWDVDHQMLSQSVRLLEQRLLTLENVFNGIGSAAILYDLFGRVVQVNARMQALMQEVGIPLFDRTAVDLVSELAEIDMSGARQHLYYVVLDRTLVNLPAPRVSGDGRTFVLSMKPLEQAVAQQSAGEPDAPFHLGGILIELLDVTMFQTLCRLKEEVIDRINFNLKNDLESILLAAGLLDDQGLVPARRARVSAILDEKIDSVRDVIRLSQRYLDVEVGVKSVERYPINGLTALKMAMKELEVRAGERGIRFEPQLPELVGLVMAEPQILKDVLKTVLDVLVSDGADGSPLSVRLVEHADSVIYSLANDGFGLPDDRLQDYLFGDGAISTEEFRKLRGMVEQVREWGGRLQANSEVGKGMRFTLQLKRFI